MSTDTRTHSGQLVQAHAAAQRTNAACMATHLKLQLPLRAGPVTLSSETKVTLLPLGHRSPKMSASSVTVLPPDSCECKVQAGQRQVLYQPVLASACIPLALLLTLFMKASGIKARLQASPSMLRICAAWHEKHPSACWHDATDSPLGCR